MMKVRVRNQRGLTLIEVLIAIVINALMAIAAFSIFIASTYLQYDAYNHNLVNNEVRKVADYLTTDVREAVEVVNQDASGTYSNAADTLILKMPALSKTANSAAGLAVGDPINVDSTVPTNFDYVVYTPDSLTGFSKRVVLPSASSSRSAETRILGRGSNNELGFKAKFDSKPDALGTNVVNFRFESVRPNHPRLGARKDFTEVVSGSIRLRNLKPVPSGGV